MPGLLGANVHPSQTCPGSAVDFKRATARSGSEFQRSPSRSTTSSGKQNIIASPLEKEFFAFLKKHAIDYDPKYVWG
jgi:hypothetical protein